MKKNLIMTCNEDLTREELILKIKRLETRITFRDEKLISLHEEVKGLWKKVEVQCHARRLANIRADKSDRLRKYPDAIM
jgi:hypothetical protein